MRTEKVSDSTVAIFLATFKTGRQRFTRLADFQQTLKLVFDILTYGLGSILPRLAGLLLLPLFTRYLTPEDYGIIALLGWIGIAVTPFMSAGLGAGLAPQVFRPEYAGRRREVIWSALMIVVTASFVVLACVCMAEQELFVWLGVPASARVGFWLGIAALSLSAWLIPLQGNLQFIGRARAFTAVTLVTTIGTLLLAVWLVVFLRRGVRGWFEAMIGGQVVALGLASLFCRGLGAPCISGAIVRRLLASGFVLMPATFFVYALQHGNKWLLQEKHGLAELGVYNVAFNLSLAMNLVGSAVQSAWFPWIMAQRERRAEALEKNADMLVWLALGLGVLNLWIGAMARPLMALMTAPPFHHAYPLVALNAHAHVWAGLFCVAVIPLYFAGKENRQTLVWAVATLLYTIFSLWLVPQWGAFGCAWSTVLGFLCAGIMVIASTCFSSSEVRNTLRVRLRRFGSILGLWVGGGIALTMEASRPEWWPWLSVFVCLGSALTGWLLLTSSERALIGRGLEKVVGGGSLHRRH
jgi:O-antigen/teichoic acid export membrane protein